MGWQDDEFIAITKVQSQQPPCPCHVSSSQGWLWQQEDLLPATGIPSEGFYGDITTYQEATTTIVFYFFL